MQAIPEREAAVAKLADYFAGARDGDYFAWFKIEAETAQSMAAAGHGRDDVRRALRRLKRPYEATRGEGITLSCPDNAITIVRGRFVRIDGAVRIAERTQKQLQQRHLDKMTPEDQRRMLIAAGFFGAIRTIVADNRRGLLK